VIALYVSPAPLRATAFYLYNLWKGLPETPASDPHIRKAIQQEATEKGQAYMFQCLENIDPVFAASITSNDSYRTTRALEVFRQTGKRISEYAQHKTYPDDISFQVYGFSRERNILYERIEKRVDAMLQNGLYTEVHNFYKKTGFYKEGETVLYNAIKTIGVQEFLCNEHIRTAWDKGENISKTLMTDCIALIKRNSKRYAKRQVTFFKRFPFVHWFDIDNTEHNTYEYIWKYIMQKYHS
jgi:tRNA dimethylallyltransferase